MQLNGQRLQHLCEQLSLCRLPILRLCDDINDAFHSTCVAICVHFSQQQQQQQSRTHAWQELFETAKLSTLCFFSVATPVCAHSAHTRTPTHTLISFYTLARVRKNLCNLYVLCRCVCVLNTWRALRVALSRVSTHREHTHTLKTATVALTNAALVCDACLLYLFASYCVHVIFFVYARSLLYSKIHTIKSRYTQQSRGSR